MCVIFAFYNSRILITHELEYCIVMRQKRMCSSWTEQPILNPKWLHFLFLQLASSIKWTKCWKCWSYPPIVRQWHYTMQLVDIIHLLFITWKYSNYKAHSVLRLPLKDSCRPLHQIFFFALFFRVSIVMYQYAAHSNCYLQCKLTPCIVFDTIFKE